MQQYRSPAPFLILNSSRENLSARIFKSTLNPLLMSFSIETPASFCLLNVDAELKKYFARNLLQNFEKFCKRNCGERAIFLRSNCFDQKHYRKMLKDYIWVKMLSHNTFVIFQVKISCQFSPDFKIVCTLVGGKKFLEIKQ